MSNASWWERAERVLPGGVNSPVRAFKSVPGDPVFFRNAKGCRFTDEDGREYIDWCLSWGPMILGHADPDVEAAAIEAMVKAPASARPAAARSCWPRPSWPACRTSTRCASSAAAPRRS